MSMSTAAASTIPTVLVGSTRPNAAVTAMMMLDEADGPATPRDEREAEHPTLGPRIGIGIGIVVVVVVVVVAVVVVVVALPGPRPRLGPWRWLCHWQQRHRSASRHDDPEPERGRRVTCLVVVATIAMIAIIGGAAGVVIGVRIALAIITARAGAAGRREWRGWRGAVGAGSASGVRVVLPRLVLGVRLAVSAAAFTAPPRRLVLLLLAPSSAGARTITIMTRTITIMTRTTTIMTRITTTPAADFGGVDGSDRDGVDERQLEDHDRLVLAILLRVVIHATRGAARRPPL